MVKHSQLVTYLFIGLFFLIKTSVLATDSHAKTTPVIPNESDHLNTAIFPVGPHSPVSTNKRRGRRALAQPSALLDIETGLEFRVGQAIFEKLWVFAPSSTTASDGLGPLYNARACSQCHINSARGLAYNEEKFATNTPLSPSPALIIRLLGSNGHHNGDPVYGAQIQTFAYPGGAAEAEISVRYEALAKKFTDGEVVSLYKPSYNIENLRYGELDKQTTFSPRLAPALAGSSFLETIPERSILEKADPDDTNKDGISGKVSWINSDSNTPMVGRFGWKAEQISLRTQNLVALNNDIGISSSLFPNHAGDCTAAQQECVHQPHGAVKTLHDGFEASETMSNLLDLYVSYLSIPKRTVDAGEERKGFKLFKQLNCDGCHTPSYTVNDSKTKLNALNNEPDAKSTYRIWPFTDLLLHDMGPALADQTFANKTSDAKQAREWRTPPLWGLGLHKKTSGAMHLLHDGRARSISEAILWHGGEAKTSQQAFMSLEKPERQALIDYLETL
jgi:CxxC motif-containing protein (DUF1111 family)